jgi:hypothetical protein
VSALPHFLLTLKRGLLIGPDLFLQIEIGVMANSLAASLWDFRLGFYGELSNKKLILKGVMLMGELEVDVGVLKERVDNMEKTQDGLIKKLDVFQNTLMVTLGGVIVNLIVLLLKK